MHVRETRHETTPLGTGQRGQEGGVGGGAVRPLGAPLQSAWPVLDDRLKGAEPVHEVAAGAAPDDDSDSMAMATPSFISKPNAHHY